MDVNWRWHCRLRGLLPLSPGAAADDGRVVLARPDDLEVRKYQILEADARGATKSIGSVSVETVRQVGVTADAPTMIGVTDDDLYLFREGRKNRFLPERRVSYLSVALARSGAFLAAAFTDMMFAGQTLALADATGKVIWTKDMDAPITVVGIAPDGGAVAAGLESGLLVAFDAGRARLWEVALESPPVALILTPRGARCVAVTAAGQVIAVDGGDVAWSADLSINGLLEPGSVALTADARGALTAVAGGSEGGGWISLLDSEGRAAWEHNTEGRLTGAALSPSGSLLSVSQIDGELLQFEIDIASGAAAGGLLPDEEYRRALAARDAGKTAEARQALLRVLDADPGHLAACDELIALDDAARARALSEADQLALDGSYAEAIAALDAVASLLPSDPELPTRRAGLIEAAERQASEQAGLAESEGDPERAVEQWRSFLKLDPKRRRAREEVGRLNGLLADRWVREGEEALAAGRDEDAATAWQRAQAAKPSEELASRLREIELQRYLRAGVDLYSRQRFPEAAFQLRKVLALQPDHPEALRYLAYIGSSGPQSSLSERFSRLE